MKMNILTVILVLCIQITCLRGDEYTITIKRWRPTSGDYLQVDREGIYVTFLNRLIQLDHSDLSVPKQDVSFTSSPFESVILSLGSREKQFIVLCSVDSRSCMIYNTSDFSEPLSVESFAQNAARNDRVNAGMFTADDTYYLGIMQPGSISLKQYRIAENGSQELLRSTKTSIEAMNFGQRRYHGGFSHGEYSYFIISDTHDASGSKVITLRVMRACNNATEGGNFSGLYEEEFICGTKTYPDSNAFYDRIASVSLVEDFFTRSPGATIVISRGCRTPQGTSQGVQCNLLCTIKLADIDRAMSRRFNECSEGRGKIFPAWAGSSRECNASNFEAEEFCKLPTNVTLSDKEDGGDKINVGVINFEFDNPNQRYNVTASLALRIDDVSLLVVAFGIGNFYNFVYKFAISNTTRTLNVFRDGFDRSDPIVPVVWALQWYEGLNYIIVSTSNSVFKMPLEQCSSNNDCSGCLMEDNPLCGWCVVENKCSRRSQCRYGNSTSSNRWISSSGLSANINTQCIMNNISTDQLVLDNQQILNVTVGGPGLPANLDNETYMCHFEDSRGRFNITVPAMEVDPLTQYTCDITNQTFMYDGVQAVMHFSFVSSLVNVPFDRTDYALTLYRCNATNSCSECVETRNACGWCVINKLCRGTAQDCTNTSNFLQLDTAALFQEVCPLLDLENGTTNYTQHVRAQPKLHLTTKNLPDIVPGYSYMCLIGNTMFNATRDNETSLTCQVGNNALSLTSSNGMEVTDIGIIWNGPAVNHRIDTINAASLTLYDCRVLATDCSSCIASRGTPGFECGWCDHANCSISEECRQSVPSNPFIVIGEQCPAPVITGFSPSSGPPDGGTILTIEGRDLGVEFDDFLEAGSNITVGGVICTPLNMDYTSGMQVLCQTGSGMEKGAQRVEVNLVRDAGIRTGRCDGFMVVLPTVSSVEPAFGPIAGGSRLTINGTGLDIGTSTRITLDEARGLKCRNIVRTSTQITCTSTNTYSPSSSPTPLVVQIDAQTISETNVSFEYRSNPNITTRNPQNTIPSGGIGISFEGSDLDVSQNPRLIIMEENCTCYSINSTRLSCITPELAGGSTNVTTLYMLKFDEYVNEAWLGIKPDPSNFTLATPTVVIGSPLQIQVQINGSNIDSVDQSEIRVIIGNQNCESLTATESMVSCNVPEMGAGNAVVNVLIGQNLNFTLTDELQYVPATTIPSTATTIQIQVIIGVGVSVVVILFILILVTLIVTLVCGYHRNIKRRKENLLNSIELKNLHQREMKPADVYAVGSELTSHLPAKLMIPSKEIQISDICLGKGHYGIVYKAHWVKQHQQGRRDTCKHSVKAVAIKVMKEKLADSEQERLFSEMDLMLDLSHPNIMTLEGICYMELEGMGKGTVPCIVMPFMANGSLLDYLKMKRKDLDLNKEDMNEDEDWDTIISVRKLLLKMCHQVSLGMQYLAFKRIVHRDLAARNCMLDSGGNIKVSDFGLSEDIYNTGYFRMEKDDAVRLPFKWMAPESLNDHYFSEKTDVWSFGITCWEVFSVGKMPYPGVDSIDLPRLLKEGRRLDCPTNAACDQEIYEKMSKCWEYSQEDRPTFSDLSALFDESLQSIACYMELTMDLLLPRVSLDSIESSELSPSLVSPVMKKITSQSNTYEELS